MKTLIDQWHSIALNIAVINEVRLQGSKCVSNFEHGMEKEETCFRGTGICPPTRRCLVTVNVLQKLLKQYLDCRRHSQWPQYSLSPLER
jgi:hypothetical protein